MSSDITFKRDGQTTWKHNTSDVACRQRRCIKRNTALLSWNDDWIMETISFYCYRFFFFFFLQNVLFPQILQNVFSHITPVPNRLMSVSPFSNIKQTNYRQKEKKKKNQVIHLGMRENLLGWINENFKVALCCNKWQCGVVTVVKKCFTFWVGDCAAYALKKKKHRWEVILIRNVMSRNVYRAY